VLLRKAKRYYEKKEQTGDTQSGIAPYRSARGTARQQNSVGRHFRVLKRGWQSYYAIH
jgi:hypothetical protein